MKNIYFLTDIHGQYHLFSGIVDGIEPDSTLVFGGDANDRGDYGYRIMRELLDSPQVIYLKGNHEDMFVKAAYAILGYCGQNDIFQAALQSKDKICAETIITSCSNPDVLLYLQNDGFQTLVSWILDGAQEEFLEKVNALPLTFSYENIDFCHAGTTYKIFSDIADKEYHKEPIPEKDIQDILWNRTMLPLGWKTDRICVFGHTPTVTLPTGIYGRDKSVARSHPCAWHDKMRAIDKRGGWKIDMDTSAAWSNRAYILNCLTMEVYGFYDEIDKEDNHIIKIIDEYKII